MSDLGFLPRETQTYTASIHAGSDPTQWMPGWDCIPPIHIGVTYKYDAVGQTHNGYAYSRYGNPTRRALEECLANLENGKYCKTFSSGMAAIVTVTHLLQSGDHILVGDHLYGGTSRYFSDIASRNNITTTYVDAADLDKVKKAITPNTKMLWLESPSNPLLKIIDIAALSNLVHSISKEIIVVVDNTFLTSYFQKPLELGADISLASLTKYYNGHGDVTMGAVMFRRDDLYERLHYFQYALGAIPSPYDCSLVIRSLKTLPLRMERHMQNGLLVAKFLEQHPNVRKVIHPAFKSHEQHELAKKQSYGHSGVLAFYLKGGEKEARKFLESLKIFVLTGSLGDCGSLINMPLRMIDVPTHLKENTEIINTSLVRVSVGLENIDDLIADLKQALDAAFA